MEEPKLVDNMPHVFVYDGRLDWLNFLPFDLKNFICIDCNCFIPYTESTTTTTYNLILELHLSHPDKKILFYNKSEGFQKDTYKSINLIAKRLLDNSIFKLSDIVILNGCYPHPYNLDFYTAFIEKNNFVKLKTFFVNTMELMFLDALYPKNSGLCNFLSKIKYDVTKKHKNFLLYIGKVNEHRLYIFEKLYKLGLLENSYYTCYFQQSLVEKLNTKNYPSYLRDGILYAQSIANTFPIKLDNSDEFGNLRMWGFKVSERHHYEDTFFSIIPETHFSHSSQNKHAEYIMDDQIFITEKTYRIIAGKSPFIMVGFTNTLQVLKDAGYKTFHPYIDESYDQIENDEERLIAIINEIQRLCSFSKEQWTEWAKKVVPIVEYNQRRLFDFLSPKYLEIY